METEPLPGRGRGHAEGIPVQIAVIGKHVDRDGAVFVHRSGIVQRIRAVIDRFTVIVTVAVSVAPLPSEMV